MDFDSDLMQIQGVILKSNSTHLFKNITFRGGNEDAIKNIVEALKTLLLTKNYISEQNWNHSYEAALRKINIFLVLNSEMDYFNILVDSDDIGHLIWTCPIMTKCLLIHVIWSLNLDSFYCEMIRYTCPKLSIDMLTAAIENMKYSEPTEAIKRSSDLAYSAYYILCNYSDSSRYCMLKMDCERLYDSIVNILKYFGDSPIKSKLEGWKNRQLYLYTADVTINLFEMLIKCFRRYLNQYDDFRPDIHDVYSLTHCDECSNASVNIKEEIQNTLKKINELIVRTTAENFMCITVDVYCSWSETLSKEDCSKTLQRQIGELAYELQNVIKCDESLDANLILLIAPIAQKPEELSDIINSADENVLIEKASIKSDEQIHWLKALCEKDYLLTENKSIECIMDNIDLLTEEFGLIIRKCIETLYFKIKAEFSPEIKRLSMMCFDRLNLDSKKSIMTEIFSEKPLTNELELPDFEVKMTEYLNKVIELDESTISNLLYIYIQNPEKLYSKLVELGSKNSRAVFIVRLLDYLTEFNRTNALNVNNESLVLHSLNKLNVERFENDYEKQSLTVFIKEIYLRNIVDGNALVLKYVMPSIDFHLKSTNLTFLLLFLQCFNEIDTIACKIPRSAILAWLAQIMETVRWNIGNFSMEAVKIIELSTTLQQNLINSFIADSNIDEREWKWLLEKISFLSPMNAVYYSQLLPENTKQLLDTSMKDSEIKHCLLYLLPRCTSKEFTTTYDLLLSKFEPIQVFKLVCDILRVLASKSDEYDQNRFNSCFEHSCSNLSIVLQDSKIWERSDFIVFEEAVALINSTTLSNDAIFNSFLRLLSQNLQFIKSTTSIGTESIEEMIDTLQNESYRSILRNCT